MEMEESKIVFDDEVAKGLLHGTSLTETIEGIFNGFGVTVRKPSHINTLYEAGCFGKGSLSKSKPFSTLYRRITPGLYKQRLTETNEAVRVLAKMKEMYESCRSRFLDWRKSTNADISLTDFENIEELFKDNESRFDFNEIVPAEPEKSEQNSENSTEVKIIKNNLPPAEEILLLNLEEALFLVRDLKWLNISFQGKKLSTSEIWLTFCETQENFMYRYLAYKYFRSNNWIVKSGLKYGCDFLLYKQRGPAHVHSSYMVLIDAYLGENRDTTAVKINDATINGLIRMAENAAKEVIIAKVVLPHEFTYKAPNLDSSLEKCTVSSCILHRWLPTYPIPSEFSIPGGSKSTKGLKNHGEYVEYPKRTRAEVEKDSNLENESVAAKKPRTVAIEEHLTSEQNVSPNSSKKEPETVAEKVI